MTVLESAPTSDEAAPSTVEPSGRDAKVREILRRYFRSPRDKSLEPAIGYLLRHLKDVESAVAENANGRLGEGRALALLGEAGAGKSRALQYVFKRHEFKEPRPGGLVAPLVSVAAPSPCTLRQLGNAVLDALGYHATRDLKENVVWDVIRQQVKVLGIRFLHIDELQHLFQVNDQNEIAKVRNTLKNLMQQRDWPLFLIVSGLPEVYRHLEEDEQIKRRTSFVRFESLGESEAHYLRQAIAVFGGQLAELDTRTLADVDIASRLLVAGSHQLGTCIEIIQDAVREACEKDSAQLLIEHFATVYATRSGCRPDDNPFISDRAPAATKRDAPVDDTDRKSLRNWRPK